MSAAGTITFDWGDAEHRFRLAIGELRELQEKCDSGPELIRWRIETGQWRIDDLRETLRLGLIGAGMKAEEALTLVRRHVDGRPLLFSKAPAFAVLTAALAGSPKDPVGKDAPEETANEAMAASEAASSSPDSTPPAS